MILSRAIIARGVQKIPLQPATIKIICIEIEVINVGVAIWLADYKGNYRSDHLLRRIKSA